MRLVYLDPALDDLAWVRLYYERVFPEGGYNAARRFEEAERLLTDHPRIGTPLGSGGLRRRKILKTPFTLIYRVTSERIEILRVMDDRRG